MPSRSPLLSAALVACAVAFPVAVAAQVWMGGPTLAYGAPPVPSPGPWFNPVELGWSWLTGLAVGGWFGLCYYGWAAERDAEHAGQDDEWHQ